MNMLNQKLAGENLLYTQAQVFLDAVIDDINAMLSSDYPSFSEFTPDTSKKYPNYNFFPDKYIRSVVIPGAALKFYTTDEEGAQVANQYSYDYRQNLFYMQRDYVSQVHPEFRDCSDGCTEDNWDDFRGWSL